MLRGCKSPKPESAIGSGMKTTDVYHHGSLRAELVRLGLETLEREGAEVLSLRSLAEKAGVSKTAPYRHFPDREAFLGALADEGNRLLYAALEGAAAAESGARISSMGRAYLDFAVAHPALYRLMNSPLICRLPDELMVWARRSIALLISTLAASTGETGGSSTGDQPDSDSAAAAWAYVHGLVLLRIDGLFPGFLPTPDWDYLATRIPVLGTRPRSSGRKKKQGEAR
jgi:AcrR family transcriptional regulator